MSPDSRIAYQRSALLVVTVVLWLCTLAWLVPMIVSVLWTAFAAGVLVFQHSRKSRPQSA